MPEFLKLIEPSIAREYLLSQIKGDPISVENLPTVDAIGRILAQDVISPQDLPNFIRSTVDGYAVRSKDTHGASESIPGYLKVVGEIQMGEEANVEMEVGECVLIHTGGMIPEQADAVLMVEYTQTTKRDEIEFYRSVSVGENVIQIGEDIRMGEIVLEKGKKLRPSDIGGLMALGIEQILVTQRLTIGILSTGDELIDHTEPYKKGKIRDINSHTLGAVLVSHGYIPRYYGIAKDLFDDIFNKARVALAENDALIITAGSSASVRDLTADVINKLGTPGVLVHGLNTKPGKPTILGMCAKKPVIGLPGNPVSALTNIYMMVLPALRKLSGEITVKHLPYIIGRLTININSLAGREDWVPVNISYQGDEILITPIFGKSNLIINLSKADAFVQVQPSETGIAENRIVKAYLQE